MDLQHIHLSLDSHAVTRLTRLAEQRQLTLADLIRNILNQHLDDVRHRRADAPADDGSETFVYTMQQDQAAEFDPLRAWLGLSPEARWDAAERGLVRLPWAEMEAAETADDAIPI